MLEDGEGGKEKWCSRVSGLQCEMLGPVQLCCWLAG